MTRKEIAFWFVAGVVLCAAFLPLPAKAQNEGITLRTSSSIGGPPLTSEETLRLLALERIIATQSATIGKALDVLKAYADKSAAQPILLGGMPMQQPQPVPVAEEKPCEDSLIGCALRGVGSLLKTAGNVGINFLDRNAVPLLQVVAADRSATRQATAAIETARFGYMERRDVAQANAATNQALGLNLQNVALAGYNTIGLLPPQTVNNISGTGINFGNGTLTYSPITGSYNPTNPTARVCQATTAGLICQ